MGVEPTQGTGSPTAVRGSFTLFRVPVGGGDRVPLRIHWTLLLAIPYFAGGFVPEIARRGVTSLGRGEGYLLGVLLAVGLFVAVALHELAHTLVGIRLGARVRGITLMFLGGVSEMSHKPDRPSGEAIMAAVGPATSLGIAALAYLVSRLASGLGGQLSLLFAHLNLAIGVFNLLPAFPLDGGRVLRGALSRPLGAARATAVASFVGKVVAVLLGVVGALSGMLFVTLIAVFIYFGASAESRAEMVGERLAHIPVSTLMQPLAVTVSDDATVEEAAARLLSSRRPALLVEHDGRLAGRLTSSRVQAVPYHYRTRVTVGAIMGEAPPAVSPRDPLRAAFERMSELSLEELPVVDEGQLAGVVSLADLERFLEESEAATAPGGQRELPTT